MEEEEEYQSDDSRDIGNDYDMNDGFVVPDDDDDDEGDYKPKKGKKGKTQGRSKKVKSEDELEEKFNDIGLSAQE